VVAILGYGRFGRALGEQLEQLGVSVRAWDPVASLPPSVATASPAEAVDGAEFVVLSVPVPHTRAALAAVRAHLHARHTVIEVGSVKVAPVLELEAVLGSSVPWVATHPLFGPLSLALGERPLRTVVCPNAMHPEAVERVVTFWREVGCEVVLLDPETHDREMAKTHALAFFVAKGFLDCGIELELPYLPPSVGGIARTVATARADAGQLFATLHRQNPYADEARSQLLEALTASDAALRAPVAAGEEAHQEGEALRLAEPVGTPPQLKEVRDLIDDLDAELVSLLERRARLALRARWVKEHSGRGITDRVREEELLASRRALAARAGLDPEAIDAIFRAIVRFSRQHQAKGEGGSSCSRRMRRQTLSTSWWSKRSAFPASRPGCTASRARAACSWRST
jgi:prephenate dehydrogenase